VCIANTDDFLGDKNSSKMSLWIFSFIVNYGKVQICSIMKNFGRGWNHRIAYDFNRGKFNLDMCIYGPRSYGEFRIKKGFSGRLEVDVMNTPVRVPPSQDFATKEWVWGAMAGMKKEYRISKSLRGNAQVLYNLFNPHYKSPYTDRLNMRIGIEYKISKKKPKAQE
jgi:hypothetical protein